MRIQIIGKRLKEVRHVKNLAQRDLAEILGITPQALSKKEKLDKTTLENYQIDSLEEQLQISQDFLTGGVDKYNERRYEDKILTKPLNKEPLLNPIAHMALSFNKQQVKTTLAIMQYIAQSNDFQLNMLKNICDVTFKTSIQNDDTNK